jgi:hypothetical protein
VTEQTPETMLRSPTPTTTTIKHHSSGLKDSDMKEGKGSTTVQKNTRKFAILYIKFVYATVKNVMKRYRRVNMVEIIGTHVCK